MPTKKKESAEPTEEQEAIIEKVKEEAFTPPVAEPEPVDEELQDFLKKAEAQFLAEREKALEPKVLCRHENKHHVGLKGKSEPLFCDLPLGHDGNHQADYECLRQDNGTYEDSILEKQRRGDKEFVVRTERAEWTDLASTPRQNIKPDAAQLAYIRQHKEPIDGKLYEESHRTR